MSDVKFKCPQCGTKASQAKIIANHYSCINSRCSLNVRLLVHGEVTTTGNLSKVYGWVLQPGAELRKKYEIVKMIGKGGYGATYLAKDHSMFDQLRAIKEVPRQFCDDKEDEFLTLLNHPAIPRLYERFNHGQFHYSVMEFVEGESLEHMVKRRAGGLPENELLKLARQIFDVLIYTHSKKIVHRDLKPDNILVLKNGSIALIDFGIAKEHRTGIGTRHLARAASYCYSSPEQYHAGKGFTDFKSDIYSLGAILYFMAIGIEPPDALSRDGARDISPSPRSLNPGISKPLETVIIKATKMNKKTRYASMREMKQALFGKNATTQKNYCSRCKTLVQPGDKFCRKCGHATQSVPPSNQSAFRFRSGKEAHTVQQLIDLCYEHWHESTDYLYSGKFETWLKIIPGGQSLAQEAVNIRKKIRLKHEGLNHFLLSSGFGKRPKLAVKPGKIDIGISALQKRNAFFLSLSNPGKGFLSGNVSSSADWIQPEKKTFSCLQGNTIQLRLNVALTPNLKKQNLDTSVVIKSSGGTISIPVRYSPSPTKYKTEQHQKSTKRGAFSYISPVLIFIFFMMIIRYIGPHAQLRISDVKIIGISGLFLSVLNFHYGRFGKFLGFIMGACIGAVLNFLAYYIYPFLNFTIIDPLMQYLTSSASVEVNIAGWGMFGAYLGGTFVLFSRKKNKP